MKSIERQLLKLVLSHAFNLATPSVRLAITRKKLYKKQLKKTHAQKFGDREHEACDRKKALKALRAITQHRNRGKKHDRNNIRYYR